MLAPRRRGGAAETRGETPQKTRREGEHGGGQGTQGRKTRDEARTKEPRQKRTGQENNGKGQTAKGATREENDREKDNRTPRDTGQRRKDRAETNRRTQQGEEPTMSF